MVRRLELADQPALSFCEAFHPRQQVVGHDRGEGDRNQQACEDRDDVGVTEWCEQPSLDARKRKQRHEHEDDDHCGVDDARPHFVGCRNHHVEHGAGAALLPVFAQPAEDVLDIDHRVIDQLADGDRKAAQGHRVDRQAKQLEDDGRGQDRDRDRRQRNGRRAPVEKKREQDDGHDKGGFEQHPLHVLDRVFDETRLPEYDLAGFHAGRQAGLQLREHLCDLSRQLHRVDIGLLLDRDDHGGLAHIARVTALDLGRKFNIRYLPKQDRTSFDGGNDDVAQVFQARRASDIADEKFAGILIGEPAAGVGAELP